jgi:vanillate/3-O-methylgallate O-demethylase
LTFRYEIEGPTALQIVASAHGRPLEPIKFFKMTDFTLGGVPVRALGHTMAGVPGSESVGLEIWGPIEEAATCLDALLTAGEEFGLVRGGALAYYTGAVESGYMAQATPAVYTGDEMRPYREWLSGNGYEGTLSIGGSYRSDDIEDYYASPWDFGYGHLVKFDHEFIGREALVKLNDEPHRRKCWLRWNDDDVTRLYASNLFGGAQRAKYLETPLARYARVMCDSVMLGDQRVGFSTLTAYTVNMGAWCSIAMLDEESAVDGQEVTIVWGEENGGTPKLTVERHVQTSVRATVSTSPLV